MLEGVNVRIDVAWKNQAAAGFDDTAALAGARQVLRIQRLGRTGLRDSSPLDEEGMAREYSPPGIEGEDEIRVADEQRGVSTSLRRRQTRASFFPANGCARGRSIASATGA